MTISATRPVTDETPRERSRRAAVASVANDAAGVVKAAADDAAARFPGLVAMGLSGFDDAGRRIKASSDETVRLGTVLSFGFAAGLLVGGANRVLVGAALVPAAMLGMTLLERTAAGRPTGTSKGAGGL